MPVMDIVPTHSAFLELKDERLGMEEGYRFLDEKRLILASEILSELRSYEAAMAEFRADYRRAEEALRQAVGRIGLDGVQLYPAAAPVSGDMRLETRSILGVVSHEVACRMDPLQAPEAVWTCSEAETCRQIFRDLIPRAAKLAAMAGNLERMRREYVRTARRARALEDVLLPEMDEAMKVVETALEELEREEIIRVRKAIESS